MHNECDSLTYWHKIILDWLTCCSINQSLFNPELLYLKIDLLSHLMCGRGKY